MTPRKHLTLSVLTILLSLLSAIALRGQQSHQQLPANSPSAKRWDIRYYDSLLVSSEIDRTTGFSKPMNVRSKFLGRAGGLSPFSSFKIPGALPANRETNSGGNAQRVADQICYTIAGRNYLYQDSLVLFTADATMARDGNLLVPGGFGDYYATSFVRTGGMLMKTDVEGNLLWAQKYDSANYKGGDFINYSRVIELRDGSLVLIGYTQNDILYSYDIIITKTDARGNIIWNKTYSSRFWPDTYHRLGYFFIRELQEDQVTGDIYFAGSHQYWPSAITKIDAKDGHVIWSNCYNSFDLPKAFGMVQTPQGLGLFQESTDGLLNTRIDAITIDRQTGELLSHKSFMDRDPVSGPHLLFGWRTALLDNGHILLTGPTSGSVQYPVFTNTVDLYHALVVELDQNFDYVRSFGFKNRIQTNLYNTNVSLFSDGSGIFTVSDYKAIGIADAPIAVFKDAKIYHQRRRLLRNEGVYYEPPFLQLTGGGFIQAKRIMDSVALGKDGSKVEYYQLHISDTASACLGIQDSSTAIWYANYQPVNQRFDTVWHNIFQESRVKTVSSWPFSGRMGPACQVISHCDSLTLLSSDTTVCPGNSITITVRKNKKCGSPVPLEYDSSWVSKVVQLTDSTYSFQLNKSGAGYIKASLMGCTMKWDSVLITVAPEKNALSLGRDTVICPGNTVTLNAGRGFASYQWQDGSTDSIYTVRNPGTYFVSAVTACGSVLRDTVQVLPHAPVTIDLGPDRVKCNNDTVRLTAPEGYLSYTWSNNYALSATNLQTVIANPAIDTAYYIQAEKEPGCFALDTIHIAVRRSPPINLGADKNLCAGDSARFDAGSGFVSYQWNTGYTSQVITVKASGSYSVIGTTADNCKSSDTVDVKNIYSLPIVSIDKTNGICKGGTRTLLAGSFASYLWSNNATTPAIIVSDTGHYKVRVTDKNGCSGSDSVYINNIYPLPASFLGPDTSLCNYGTLPLKTLESYSEYTWSTGKSTAAIVVKEPGLYWLEVRDANGCKGRDSVIVRPKECMHGFYVPNAFTPNKDGRNDLFRPLLFGVVKQYDFSVYNRFGQRVFHSTDTREGWDGNFAGHSQSMGVFIWTCTYQFEGEPVNNEKGSVTLMR